MNTRFSKLLLAFLLLVLIVPEVGAGPYTKRLRKVFGSEEQKPRSPLYHPHTDPLNQNRASVQKHIELSSDPSNIQLRPREGKEVKYYENRQKKFEADYKDGKLLSASSWKPDGEPCPATKIIDGSGIYVTWYENGQKEKETHYKNGEPDGLATGWYENGQKKIEAHYKNGWRDGLATRWYENGQKKLEGNFKNGKEDGLWITWHENGRKMRERYYKDGELDGLETEWDEYGRKKSEGHYKIGKAVGTCALVLGVLLLLLVIRKKSGGSL